MLSGGEILPRLQRRAPTGRAADRGRLGARAAGSAALQEDILGTDFFQQARGVTAPRLRRGRIASEATSARGKCSAGLSGVLAAAKISPFAGWHRSSSLGNQLARIRARRRSALSGGPLRAGPAPKKRRLKHGALHWALRQNTGTSRKSSTEFEDRL